MKFRAHGSPMEASKVNRVNKAKRMELLEALVAANHQATLYFHSRRYEEAREWTRKANTIAWELHALQEKEKII